MKNILKAKNTLTLAALLAVAAPFSAFAANTTPTQATTPVINTASGTTVVSDSVNNNTAATQQMLAKAGNQLYVEGQLIDSATFPTPLYQSGNDVMVPLRLTASKLGYDVTWDEATKSAVVDGPVASVHIPAASGTQYTRTGKLQNINLNTTKTLAPAENKGGFLYVPASVFSLLFNDVQTYNNSVSIKAQKAYLMNGDTQVATVDSSRDQANGKNSVSFTIPSKTPTPAGTSTSTTMTTTTTQANTAKTK